MTTLEDVRHDVRYACRVLFRNPGFAAAAVATLALGIGASRVDPAVTLRAE